MAHYLICYDISSPQRLGKLYRLLVKHAIPLQKSVFYARKKSQEMDRLIDEIKNLIHPKEDDVRIYCLSAGAFQSADWLGTQFVPKDTLMITPLTQKGIPPNSAGSIPSPSSS